jgi:Protein of unknown function (DUF4238)
MKGLPPEQAQKVEQYFLRPVDTLAAEALVMLENGDDHINRESKWRSAWSRFLMSLLMRTPEDIAALKRGAAKKWAQRIPKIEAKYATKRGPNDPPTFKAYLDQFDADEVDRWGMSIAPTLIDHKGIGNILNNMRWLVRRITGDAEFLTSDRPVVMSATLKETNAYIFLPIGPKAVFVAVNDLETQRMVEGREPAEQIEALNSLVAGHAVKYVYARDDSQLVFVRKHFSTRPQRSLMERLVDFDG